MLFQDGKRSRLAAHLQEVIASDGDRSERSSDSDGKSQNPVQADQIQQDTESGEDLRPSNWLKRTTIFIF